MKQILMTYELHLIPYSSYLSYTSFMAALIAAPLFSFKWFIFDLAYSISISDPISWMRKLRDKRRKCPSVRRYLNGSDNSYKISCPNRKWWCHLGHLNGTDEVKDRANVHILSRNYKGQKFWLKTEMPTKTNNAGVPKVISQIAFKNWNTCLKTHTLWPT